MSDRSRRALKAAFVATATAGLAGSMLVTSLVFAADVSQEAARQLRRDGVILALDDILERVRERYPDARLLEAELERSGGRYVYEMEILTRARQVRELDIDASNAEILDDEEED